MKRYWIFVLIMGALITGHAQKNVYHLPLDSNKTVKGATCCYMLPTTGFKVTVSVTKVREIKGYYADYAESLLGLTNVISENKTFYKVKDVAIVPVQLPDYNQAYLVELSKNQINNNYMSKLLRHKAFIPEMDKGIQWYTTSSTPIPSFFKNYSDPSYAEMEDSFVETKIIDGVVTQVPANRTKLVSKSNSQKAQEAADAISKSRKDQYNLVAGEQETPYSAETISLMLEELKQWEENYLSLFKGLVLEDELEYTFYVTPDGPACPLFAFDATKGLSRKDIDLSKPSNYYLYLSPTYSLQSQDLLEYLHVASAQKSDKTTGYRIRKAMPVNVTLGIDGKVIHDYGEFNMSQYGHIQTLPVGQDDLDLNCIGFVF